MYLMRVGDRYYVPHFTYYHPLHVTEKTAHPPSHVGNTANPNSSQKEQEQEQRSRAEPKRIIKRVVIIKRENTLPRITSSLPREMPKERHTIHEASDRLLLGGITYRPEVAYHALSNGQNQQSPSIPFSNFLARFQIEQPITTGGSNKNTGSRQAQESSGTARKNAANRFVSYTHEFGGTYQPGSSSGTTTSVSETSGSPTARTPSNTAVTSRFGPNTPYTGSQGSGGSPSSQPTPKPSQSQPKSQQSSSGFSWLNPLSWGQAISQGLQTLATDVGNAVSSIGQAITGGSIVASASTGAAAPSTTQSGTPTSTPTTSNPVATSRFGPNTPYTGSQGSGGILGGFGSLLSGAASAIGNAVSSVGSAITGGLTTIGNAVKQGLETAGNAIKQGLADVNNAINNAYAQAYGTQPHQSSNPFQQALNDVAEASALAGYYLVEGAGGVGVELGNLVKTGKFENFGQAVQQFNAMGGQKIAQVAGYITEVALPAAVTAVVAPELLPGVIIGAAANVGLGEAISKLTTGRWQSLDQVLNEANQGEVLGAIGGVGGQLLEAGLARVAGAMTKLVTGNEELAKNVAALTPIYRTVGGALTNIGLTAPFTSNPQQIAIAGALGALGGLAPGIAGKVMSKIDEWRGTGTVAGLTKITSPLTGETTEAWAVNLPNGDKMYIVPKFTFGEGDVEGFIRQYGNKESLLTHVTPSKDFLESVSKGETLIKVPGPIGNPDWKWREWMHLQDLYLSPGEGRDTGVALAGYLGLRDTQPGIPSFPRYGRSSIREVFSRLFNPFDVGGMIGVKDSPLVFRPPKDIVDYIQQRKAYYQSIGWDPRDINNQVVKDLLNDPTYGPMVKQWLNTVRSNAARMGKSYIGLEDVLGISHERQVEIPAGAKLKGTGFTYNIWVKQTPVLLRNLPGPLQDILSDWYRLRYVEADIVPGTDALNKFEDQSNISSNRSTTNANTSSKILRSSSSGTDVDTYYEDRTGYNMRAGYNIIPIIPIYYNNRLNDRSRPITSPHSHSIPISRPHSISVSHSITLTHSHSIPISYSYTITQSYTVPYSVPISGSSTPTPTPPPPPPVYNYQYEYVVYAPPVVYSPAEYVPNTQNYEPPMGPPPVTPPFMPGGAGGGGGNNQTISGMAGEIIRL